MSRVTIVALGLLVIAAPVVAQDEAEEIEETIAAAVAEGDEEILPARREDEGTTPERPREMSGMSILGNEEAPKALVIVPWKSSELGDDITISADLGDEARPVDKEVFVRELRFYEIRKGE